MRNWIDLLRAGAGSVAICKVALLPEEGASVELHLIVLGVQVAVLALAIAIQTIRLEKGFKLFAPLFFALGLGFGLLSWQAAAFACITLMVVNLVLPSSSVFLFALAGTQLCYGLLFHCGLKQSVLAAMITGVPLLVSGATRRRLAQFSKKTK